MTKKGKAVQKPKAKAVTAPDKAPEKKTIKQKKKVSTGWQDELGTELAAYGLRVKQVVGDGNCFFRAVPPPAASTWQIGFLLWRWGDAERRTWLLRWRTNWESRLMAITWRCEQAPWPSCRGTAQTLSRSSRRTRSGATMCSVCRGCEGLALTQQAVQLCT